MYCVLTKSIRVYNMISLSLDFIFTFYKTKFTIGICKVKDNDKYLTFFCFDFVYSRTNKLPQLYSCLQY